MKKAVLKENAAYDRQAVGNRLKACRTQRGWTREFAAQGIGLAEKYYADIERGYCGMSIETAIAGAKLYGLSLDELLFGKKQDAENPAQDSASMQIFRNLPAEQQEFCLNLFFTCKNGMQKLLETKEQD